MEKYYITGAVALIIIIGGGYYFLSVKTAVQNQPLEQTEVPMQVATSTYATSTFSVVYPSVYTKDDMYAYSQVDPKKPIHGVRFTIPPMPGTNLSSDTYVSVEQLPRAKKCTGDIYLAANVKSQPLSDNGVEYSVATSSNTSAENLYEEMVYALPNSSPCTAVRYVVHSTSMDNYASSTPAQFDRTALFEAFDTIRRSLTLGSAPIVEPVMTP